VRLGAGCGPQGAQTSAPRARRPQARWAAVTAHPGEDAQRR